MSLYTHIQYIQRYTDLSLYTPIHSYTALSLYTHISIPRALREARHRIALQKLRTELAEAQAKQKTAAERLALQAAVRAESWPLDMADMEVGG